MKFLEGWKTKVAAIGLMLHAVVGAVLYFVNPESAGAMPLEIAYAEFMNGFGLLGLRKAIRKIETKPSV